MSKRFLSLLLAFVLCMSCLALPAFASDPYGPQESAFSLNGQNYSFDQPSSGSGWSYDGNYTLTLSGVQTTKMLQLINPLKDVTIVAKEGTESQVGLLELIYGITSGSSIKDSQRKVVTIQGKGTLNCERVGLDKTILKDATLKTSSFSCWGLTMSSGAIQCTSFSLGFGGTSLKNMMNLTGGSIVVDGEKNYTGVVRMSGMEQDLISQYISLFKDKTGQPLQPEVVENEFYGGYSAFAKDSTGDYTAYAVYGTPPHNHQWSEWKVTQEATCGTAGMQIRTCSSCGLTETMTIQPTGQHVPEDNTDPAKSTYCTVCGALIKAGEGSASFTDVAESDYFHDAVIWAVDKGITNGLTATSFSPESSCTRAQIVTFLWRAAGSPEPKSQENPFTDLSADDYYYDAVLWAVENGITSGTTATTFGGNSTCTRAQGMTFLYRAAGSPSAGSSSSFTDVAQGDYFAAPVQWAVENAITSGTSNTTFSPNASCTRGQIITFLYRAR